MPTSFLRKLSREARSREFTWRYGFNLAPSLVYRKNRQPLSPECEDVVARLNRDGIAIASAAELLGGRSAFDELAAEVARLEGEIAPILAEKRKFADEGDPGTKTFLYHLLGNKPMLDTSNIFARFALQAPILNVVNAYFGMYARLREYNVWRTFVTSTAARESQLWHRDREDRMILKIFVHLDDVDDGAGPFTYAPGTHMKGPIRKTPVCFVENGVKRSYDVQMEQVAPRDRWIKALGPKGTIIFADTRGYHKGGHARERERLLYISMFTSPASESRELMTRPAQRITSADPALSVALAPSRRGLWLSLPK